MEKKREKLIKKLSQLRDFAQKEGIGADEYLSIMIEHTIIGLIAIGFEEKNALSFLEKCTKEVYKNLDSFVRK